MIIRKIAIVECRKLLQAKTRGDNVAFVDGESMFGDEWELCTVDGCHPNDFGFYKMAKAVEPVLADKLK